MELPRIHALPIFIWNTPSSHHSKHPQTKYPTTDHQRFSLYIVKNVYLCKCVTYHLTDRKAQHISTLKTQHTIRVSLMPRLPRGNHVKTVSCRATVNTPLTGWNHVIGDTFPPRRLLPSGVEPGDLPWRFGNAFASKGLCRALCTGWQHTHFFPLMKNASSAGFLLRWIYFKLSCLK